MKTYVSILRGINVGGHKMIKMADLKGYYENLGFDAVQTYIQSGNVVLRTETGACKPLADKITAEIMRSTGFDVQGIVLDLEELVKIIDNNPFRADHEKKTDHLHVTILSTLPLSIDFEKINTQKGKDEELAILEKAVYLYLPGGYGKTKLTNTFFERIFKVTATTRNWKTMTGLLKLSNPLHNA